MMRRVKISEIREINGIPILVGRTKIARMRRKRKGKMAGLGIRKLTKKQKQALVNRFELGMSNRQAALQAGYSEGKSSLVIPNLLQRKPIQDALLARGITKEYIAEGIYEGTKAMHPFRPKQPDFGVRVKYIQEANKILDHYPAKRVEVEERSVKIVISERDYEKYQRFKEKMRKEQIEQSRDS